MLRRDGAAHGALLVDTSVRETTMSLHPAFVLVGGLIVIVGGAEVLLKGATRIASMLGIKPILIGLTVVAVGTSAPELAVGIIAAREGKGDLAVGNIAGTNIFNILFILGLSAAIRPLPLHLQSIRFDVPVMIAAALGLIAMASDGVLSRLEGGILVVAAVGYTAALIRISRRESAAVRKEFAEEYGPAQLEGRAWLGGAGWAVALLVVGIGLTVLGADLMVDGAVELAQPMGIADAVIGLTIVAIGTSAPELATTIVATIRNDRDVAVGNLVGSSISNILVVLGLTCLVAPGGLAVNTEVLRIDLPLAAAVAVVCWPVFRSGQTVSRFEGVAFVVAYLVYLASLLVLRS